MSSRPRRFTSRSRAVGIVVAGGVAVLATAPGGVSAAPVRQSAQPDWLLSSLNGVSVTSADRAWAVGLAETRGMQLDYIERWNGTSWFHVFAPIPGRISELEAVTSVSGRDAWAVGDFSAPHDEPSALLLHWDGRGWQLVPGAQGSGDQQLQAVSAASADDVWAVGFVERPLIEHWDGSAWTMSPSPTHRVNDQLHGVYAGSSTDAWAVGEHASGGFMIYHWDGTSWSVAPGGNGPADVESNLLGVDGSSADNVWAVGYHLSFGPTGQGQSSSEFSQLIEHWNGTSWTEVPGPKGDAAPILTSVSVVSPNDVWAVGYATKYSVVEHWNGRAWSVASRQFHGKTFAVDAQSSTNAWAVGYVGPHRLRLHWDGTTWSH